MKLNHLFWGIFLIVIGALFLLNNYLNFSLYFDSLINYWPLILILLGIKILSKSKTANSLIVVISAILTGVIVYSLIFENVTCGRFRFYKENSREKRETISSNYSPAIKKSYLDIDYSLGSFNLSTTTEKLISGEVVYKHGKYFFDGEIDDSIASYRLISEGDIPIKTFSNKKLNKLDLSIHSLPEWKLKFTTNFVENNFQLQQINLSSFDLESNFSKGYLVLNPINENSKIFLDANFSKLKVEFADSIGVEVFVNEHFSSVNFSGFTQIEKDYYKSENYENAKTHLQLNINSNFSKINISN